LQCNVKRSFANPVNGTSAGFMDRRPTIGFAHRSSRDQAINSRPRGSRYAGIEQSALARNPDHYAAV